VYFGQSGFVPHPQIDFGNRIRELRKAAAMNQEDLAHRCGLFRTYMSRIETGKANPTLTMIYSLAESLGVHVTELFDAPAEVGLAPKPPRKARPSRGRVSK
jgi:transcriptional regulator with XRE-family HTH domain